MSVVIVCRICHIYSLLVGVLQFAGEIHLSRQTECQMGVCIDSPYPHTAQIKHRPPELLSLGICHDLILHLIIICVDSDTEKTEQTGVPRNIVENAHIVLCGRFRFQICISHIGIIQVVERRHPVALFEKSP